MKRTVIAVVALFVVPLVAAAQPQDEAWWARVAAQNVLNVSSEEAHVQEQALKNTIYFATFYRGRINLHDSVTPIRAMCENGAEGKVRALALAALQTLGTAEALDYLDRYTTAEEVAYASDLIAEVIAQHHRSSLSAL